MQTVAEIEAGARDRGFASLPEAARAAMALLSVPYPDPDKMRDYEKNRGAVSRWMAAFWAAFFAAFDAELKLMGQGA